MPCNRSVADSSVIRDKVFPLLILHWGKRKKLGECVMRPYPGCDLCVHYIYDQKQLFVGICKMCFSFPCVGVSGSLCHVTGGVLGIHWSSVITLGWHPLVVGKGDSTCWESCCLRPSCDAVWRLGGKCVLLRCTREWGCPITSLAQEHQESMGLLQLLSKVSETTSRMTSMILTLIYKIFEIFQIAY